MINSISLSSGWVDCHSHLDNLTTLNQAISLNITNLIIAGTHPEQWQEAILLQKKAPKNIFLTFGIHPYWVANRSKQECKHALELLKESLPKGLALGEVGLDFRGEYLENYSQAHQLEFLLPQVELAIATEKVLIFHIVRAHQEFAHLTSQFQNRWNRRFILHGFNSNWQRARYYIDQGFYLSIGKAILNKNNHALAEAIQKTPLNSILIESDSSNKIEIILLVAKQIAELKNIPPEKILLTVKENIQNIFSKELKC